MAGGVGNYYLWTYNRKRYNLLCETLVINIAGLFGDDKNIIYFSCIVIVQTLYIMYTERNLKREGMRRI